MQFGEYQEAARKTAVYPRIGDNVVYPALGLCGESGEFAEKVKKAISDDGGQVTPERRELMLKELGDVLWYVAACASELKASLDEVVAMNLAKLASRQERGVLRGSGDDR